MNEVACPTRIVVGHAWSFLAPDPAIESQVVGLADKATSWTDVGAYYSNAFQKGHWDGQHHLMTKKKLEFPSGLATLVAETIRNAGFPCEVVDSRTYPPLGTTQVANLEGITLREDQRKAVSALLLAKRGLFRAPPGVGKTETMISLVVTLGLYPVLWLTHTRHLLQQTYDRFRVRLDGMSSVKVGLVQGNNWDVGDVTVAMVQTLSHKAHRKRVANLLSHVQVVISDEAHRASSDTWYKVLMSCSAPFRWGCSATPLDRGDGTDLLLVGSIGDIVHELTLQEAQELGILEVPHVTFIDYDPTGYDTSTGSVSDLGWSYLEDHGLVFNEKRNAAVVELCKLKVSEDRRVLVLIKRIQHGKTLYNLLRAWFEGGPHVKFVWGETSDEARQEAVKAFRSGIYRVVIASSIFDEGADIPEVDTVVIASGGNSTIKAIQRAGRGMRRKEGGSLQVYDFLDRFHPILLRHSRKRMRVYKRMGVSQVEVQRVFTTPPTWKKTYSPLDFTVV